ncbi:MAG: hypothetical protein ABIL16_00730 [candidate division WOR-3 bacterium]
MMGLFILAIDTVLIKTAYMPNPPKEYIPITPEEVMEFRNVNVWEKSAEVPLGNKTGPYPDFLPYPSDTLIRDFEGIFYTGWIPPDPQLAACSTHVGVVVNTSIAFINKFTGITEYINTLRGFFSSVIPSGGLPFDPKIAYDIISGRWIVLALYYNSSSRESHYLLAVSEGDNPLGGWYFYRLNAKYDDNTLTNNWADYPELGFNDKWIVISSQQIGFSSYAYYPKVRVLNKADAYNGTLSSWEDFVDSELGCMPSWPRVSRSTYDYSDAVYLIRFNRMYKIYGPVSSPQLSPCITLSISPYSTPPDAPQGGGYPNLEVVLATFQVYYLNGKIYYAFNEAHPLNSSLVSVRFVVVDTTGVVLEDRRLYENGISWIYPAVSVSPKGVAISFTRVGISGTNYPSATYIARVSYDTLFSPYNVYKAGLSWYFNDHGSGRNRWGDYFGGSPDPVDSSLWVIAELPKAGTDSLWTTWIANIGFKEPSTIVMEKERFIIKENGFLYTVDGRRVSKPENKGIYFYKGSNGVKRVLVLE